MPKVSVIMPVFNGEHYILESIDSVLNQSFEDLELIVVNDGSTDGTRKIVEARAEMDRRLKFISRANSGRPSFPKNEGIAAATGKYICFLDHDDLYDADRTGKLVAGLDCNPEWVAAFHDCRFIDNQGGLLPSIYLRDHDFLRRAGSYLASKGEDWYECSPSFFLYQSLVTGAMHTSTVMIALDRLPEGTAQFDTQFTICDDTDLWIRLGMQGKIGYLDRVLSSYRQHPASITRNPEKLKLDTVRLHKHNYQRIKGLLTASQDRQLRARLADCLEDLAYFKTTENRTSEARTDYLEAFWLRPNLSTVFSLTKTLISRSFLLRLRQVIR